VVFQCLKGLEKDSRGRNLAAIPVQAQLSMDRAQTRGLRASQDTVGNDKGIESSSTLI
jgi:hypothetical protein